MPEYPFHSFGHWPGPALLTQASQGREAVQTTPQPTPRARSPALRRSGNHLGEGPARAPSPQPPSTDPGLRCAQECGGPGIGWGGGEVNVVLLAFSVITPFLL